MVGIPPSFYPQPPAAGQPFETGASPTGNTNPFNWLRTVVSQFANSSTLLQLLQNFDYCIDQTANFDNFFDFIWNVDTAQGYGLDVWGRIVGVVRQLNVANASNFGFQGPTGASGDPFDVSAFYDGQPVTSNYSLTDSSFRTLILAKAMANISDGSIKSINQILLNLFPGRGDCYATDGENMTMTYTFQFLLTAVEAAIVGQSGVLPKPVGVQASVVQV